MKTLELPSLGSVRSRSMPRPQMRGAAQLTPTRKTAIIGIVLLVLVMIVAWFAVLKPRAADVTAVQEQTAVAAAANDSLRNQVAARRAQEAQLPTLSKLSDALSGRFPATAEQAKMFSMITAAAAGAGIAPQFVTNLTVAAPADALSATSAALPGVATQIGRIATQTVTLDVRGTASKIRAFIANLEKLPRAFQVTSLTLSTQTTTGKDAASVPGGNQTAAITGSMYLMPEFAAPPAAAK